VTPEQYDAWYNTPRGRWIGELEWTAVRNALRLRTSDTVLDVGCGTGWFTRRAESAAAHVVGLDIDPASLDFARRKAAGRAEYLTGDATCLPFADAAFDKVMSVAALCFVSDWPRAIAETVRVCRDRFAIGLLNRHSVLYLRKGRHGGTGAYAGAHWHTRAEVEASLRTLPVTQCRISYGVFDASGSSAARLLERVAPSTLPFGSFLLLAGQRGSCDLSSAA
jgi:ubiquinone/menaquinone biosynthesis C-methylase UbiE